MSGRRSLLTHGRAALLWAAAVPAGAALAACGGPSPGALASKTPPQILSTALAAAQAQRGFHYEIEATVSSGSTETETVVGNASPTQGVQEVVIGSDEIEVELVDGTAYLMGNAGGLQNSFGLSAAVSSAYANRWISVPTSNSLYGHIAQTVTTTGIFSQLDPTGTLTASAPGRIDGQHVIALIGGLPSSIAQGVTGSAILYVSTARPDVPVAFAAHASNSTEKVSDAGAFNGWNGLVALTAPSGAVPYSALPSS